MWIESQGTICGAESRLCSPTVSGLIFMAVTTVNHWWFLTTGTFSYCGSYKYRSKCSVFCVCLYCRDCRHLQFLQKSVCKVFFNSFMREKACSSLNGMQSFGELPVPSASLQNCLVQKHQKLSPCLRIISDKCGTQKGLTLLQQAQFKSAVLNNNFFGIYSINQIQLINFCMFWELLNIRPKYKQYYGLHSEISIYQAK